MTSEDLLSGLLILTKYHDKRYPITVLKSMIVFELHDRKMSDHDWQMMHKLGFLCSEDCWYCNV